MRFRTKKPEFMVNDGEYVIPLRLSEDLCHHLMGGWYPIGFGWGHLRPRPDGSYDLFIRQAEVQEDMNLVKLRINVFEYNERATHVLEARGFVAEGRLRRDFFRDGSYHDIVIYSIFRDSAQETHST